MRNFLKIAEGVDVMPLMCAVVRRPDLWNQHTLRTTLPGSPHFQVSDMWLRFNDMKRAAETGDASYVFDEHESVEYPAYYAFPEAQALIFGLMTKVRGERLGRCLITKLAPGGSIAAHVDGGAHAEYYDRFHIVLQGKRGNLFRAGAEVVEMRTGEIWWFDNAAEHEVSNFSDDDRVHLIVDIRCSRPAVPDVQRSAEAVAC